jgi:hypothetical protein
MKLYSVSYWVGLHKCKIIRNCKEIEIVGLLWTSDQPVSETSTYTGQHNIETQETNIHALTGFEPATPATKRL